MSPKHIAAFAGLVLMAAVAPQQPVLAARSVSSPEYRSDGDGLPEWSPVIEKVQEFLIEFDHFAGPADGRLTPETRRAIRAYQRESDLSPDGEPSEALLKHMERVGRADSLKKRLERARKEQIEEARDALAGQAATRDLVGPRETVAMAAPSGSAADCLRAPTVDCLLREASVAVGSITQDNYRDWALRDVIRAQARAGRVSDARASIRQLSDLRLVLVSLREAAAALADSGHLTQARALTATIPDDWNRARALLAIAKAETGETTAYDALLALLPRLEDRAAAVEIATELAVSLADRGETARARDAIEAVDDLPASAKPTDAQRIALGAIATAYARIGLSEPAMHALERAGDTGRDHIALAEAAGQLAQHRKAGDAQAAAARLRAPQLYVLALTKIASAQLRLGETDAARANLARARTAALDIDRPFAADAARARIAAVWSEVPDYPNAFDNVDDIDSRGLKAQTIWRLAANAPDGEAGTEDIMARAIAATERIDSPFDRAATLTQAAVKFAETQRPHDARTVFDMAVREARAIRSDWWRARIFSLLAGALLTL